MSETLEQRSVARCANEMARAAMYLRALEGLSKADSYHHAVDFFRLAEWAFFDQMVGHTIKVLYRSRRRKPKKKKQTEQDVGLWFLLKSHKRTVRERCPNYALYVGRARRLVEPLKTIRNKTHFHLDESGVLNPRKIWHRAGLTLHRLDNAIEASLHLIGILHKELRGQAYERVCYDGSDATKIAEHAYKHGLLASPETIDPQFAAMFDE